MGHNHPPNSQRFPLTFFALVFALSIPIWLIGSVWPLELLPGLPVSSLMVLCPVIAASILVYREDKTGGVIRLLKRSFDGERVKAEVWYLPAVFLWPGIALLAYGVMRLIRMPLPTPQFQGVATAGMFVTFFIAALGEELGWSGYAIDPMQDRWGALRAGIILGIVWAAWHIIPWLQVGRSPTWIAWQCLVLVSSRVLHVWIYNNAGKSVFITALGHALLNVSWQLFPNQGSHYDPRITGLLTAFTAGMVAVGWGAQTLTRKRNRLRVEFQGGVDR
jgi:hypothetical protein